MVRLIITLGQATLPENVFANRLPCESPGTELPDWIGLRNVTRKLRPGLSADDAWDDVRLLMSWRPQPLDEQLLEHGRDIERRFRLSWWDSLVVAAAQLQDCSTLLSEGFQNGMEFDTVVVSNPFALKAGESGPPYNVAETAIPRHRPRGRPKRRE